MITRLAISRRKAATWTFIGAAFFTLKPELFGTESHPVTRDEVAQLLDTEHPEIHCNQNHDHLDQSFDDWLGSLVWSDTDCGHNEGAGPAIGIAVKAGLSFPDLMRGCSESEAWIGDAQNVMQHPEKIHELLSLIPHPPVSSDAVSLEPDLVRYIKEGKSLPELLEIANQKG